MNLGKIFGGGRTPATLGEPAGSDRPLALDQINHLFVVLWTPIRRILPSEGNRVSVFEKERLNTMI